ncbi:ATP-dependent Clp protease proteolytic subunit 3, chloroplastic-like [Lathyrus oleraceus]|uniref:ATP-dependent Clp protease proteolytic subunit 3, chloroplastic-like n=1 Tax=Pisum sativum TaxID=3888 RepID=UPI0021D0AE45|nr:ATP-dependent Clp protease proteolytic subunit 3, chloroplastic-like [Pisum sativum]
MNQCMQDQYDAYLQLNYALKHIWVQVVIFFEPAKHFTKIDALASLTADDTLDTTNMLLRQRIVFLGSQADDVTADFVISQLLFLNADDPKKDIKLFINSPGGSVTAGMGIYDAMKLCNADGSTVALDFQHPWVHFSLLQEQNRRDIVCRILKL